MEIDAVAVTQKHEEHLQKYRLVIEKRLMIEKSQNLYFSTELQRRRELGIVFRKRDKGSGQHIEDKEEKLKYSILIKSKFNNN
jgi:hypothetical protein